MHGGEADPRAEADVDDASASASVLDLDIADPADARPPLEVLESLDVASVLALGHEGTESVDWTSLVPDRSGLCPECGLVDGPKHHKKCLAHPRGPSLLWVVLACVALPLPLVLFVGPGAMLFFLPVVALAVYIRTR